MKKFVCFHFDTLTSKRRFVYAGYEAQMNAAVESFKPDEKAEKLPKYEEVQQKVDEKLQQAGKDQLDAVVSAQGVAQKKEQDALAAIDQSKPAGKAEYAKKKKEFEANDARRAEELKDAAAAIESAKNAARDALRTAYGEIETKRKAEADAWAKSVMKDVVEAKLARIPSFDQRQSEITDMLDHIETGSIISGASYQKENKFSTYTYNEKTNESSAMGSVTWDKDSAKAATIAMLQSIYYEQGKEAAQKMAEKFGKESNNETDSGHINFNVWERSFAGGKDGRGGFDWVLTHNICQPKEGSDKNPELFGRVVGYMHAADSMFAGEGNQQYFDAYEKYVRDATKGGATVGNLLSPTEWAKDKAPGFFTAENSTEKDPEKALTQKKMAYANNLLSLLEAPPVYEKGASNLFTEEFDKKEEEANRLLWVAYNKKKNMLRAALYGVMDTEPDPKKWDDLVRATMKQMTGSDKIDGGALSSADPSKLMKGREIYGQLGGQLDDYAKCYLSSLIFTGDALLAGKTYKVVQEGKEVEVDAMAAYKEYVTSSLSKKGDTAQGVRDLREEMHTKIDAIPLVVTEVDGKNVAMRDPVEVEKVNSDFRKKLTRYLRENIATASDFYKAQTDGQKKPEEPAKPEEKPAEDKPKAPTKKPASEGGAPSPKPAGGEQPQPKPKAKPAPAGNPDAVAAGGGGKKEEAPGAPVAPPPVPEVVPPTPKLTDEAAAALRRVATEAKVLPRPKEGFTPEYVTGKVTEYAQKNLPAGVPNAVYHLDQSGLRLDVSTVDGQYQVKIVGASPRLKALYHLPDDVEVIPPPPKVAGGKKKSDDSPA